MKTKVITLLSLLLMVGTLCQAAVPSWVKKMPNKSNCYIGIARVATTEPNYRESASRMALAEIAGQIGTYIESNSLLKLIDVDGQSKELFEHSIQQGIENYLEGQQMVDSYEDKGFYSVYYELDKDVYAAAVEKRRQTAIDLGMDMYRQGKAADDQNQLTVAAMHYAKGLELIEQYLYLTLETNYAGGRFNVANELYSGFINAFNGMAMVPNMNMMQVEAFKPAKEGIAVCLSRKGVVVPNAKLVAKFTSGSGTLTPSATTDVNGTSYFYVSNVTSRDAVQSVEISIDDSFMMTLPEAYRSLIDKSSWPVVKVTLALVNANYTVKFAVKKNDVAACEQSVRSLLANNYFEFVDSDDADLYIEYSTTIEKGGDVSTGGIANLSQLYCSMVIKIYDNASHTLLLEYSIPNTAVLQSQGKSEAQILQSCARTLVMQCNKELPVALKRLNVK
ncbi:MAG: LPP20 family lipoprotein [Rikenellaceae bacterium]